ncbi:MAG: D-alanyl-D-alanine carboxypeptidase/D-alanyl-D-alanine endopeptidase, partial [Nocardioidaceae bacterium]
PGRRDAPGRAWRRYPVVAVLALLVAASAAYWFDLGPRWFGFDYPSPVTQPAEVPAPPGLTLPTAKPAGSVADPSAEQPVDPAAVRRALAPLVGSKALGRHVAVEVAELSDDHTVYTHGPNRITPASTMKLLTTTAALQVLGPEHRFDTTVVARRASRQVVLVGGGDPLLARSPDPNGDGYPVRADLRTLAKSTATALKQSGRTRIRLGYDTSLFTGPAANPRWPGSYLTEDVVSRISPLWVDEGRVRNGLALRSPDPSAAAAEVFRSELEKHGIRVHGTPAPKLAPHAAEELAKVQSAPLAEIVQHILEASDNEGAEVLARQVAIAEGRPASFSGGVAAVRRVLIRLGIDLTGDRFYDGSGLSRMDRLRPGTLLSVLETAASGGRPELRPVVADVPVAGFTGSLAYRFETGDPAGLGTVRAKTGTLTGVSGLAGTVTSKDGAVMAFVAIANGVRVEDTLAARARLDDIAAALAGCTCSAAGGPTPSAGPGATGTPTPSGSPAPSASATP